MSSDFYTGKPRPRPWREGRIEEEGEDEVHDRKKRWRTRRAVFGMTGGAASCAFRPTRLVQTYCKQNGVRTKDLIDHLMKKKLV